REVHNIYNHWIRVDETFELEPGYQFQLKVKGDYVSVDDILLKPAGANVFITTSGDFDLFNNFPYEN
ncbi:MAG: hypothetical protein ACQERU_09785, partial [Bacteroidota bacterium]